MMVQAPIDLKVEDRTVQATIGLDTGFIGFTETNCEQTNEFYYGESPVEFKKGLLKK